MFAKMIGVSVNTIRASEKGSRPLTKETAMRIAYTTMVSPHWLLDDAASPDDPRSWGGSEYTLEYYRSLGLSHPMPVEVDGNFGLAVFYMRPSHRVARLMRVAMRFRKHIVCAELLKESISKIATEMDLAEYLEKEMPDALSPTSIRTLMMGGKVIAESPDDGSDMATTNAALVLSCATLFEWSAALEGSEADRVALLARLDSARELIRQSFDKKPPRKPQPASRSRPQKA